MKRNDAREIWVADSETDPFKFMRKPRPFLWGAYNGIDYHEFADTDKFVDFISEKDCIVYAHNGGKFDWHFIFHRLEAFQPLMVINGRVAKFKIGLAEFRDSFNIMPMPLASVGKTEIDYNKFEASVRKKHMAEISAYLRDDCVYLHLMVTEFIKEFDLHLTQAGASVAAWRKITGEDVPETNVTFYDEIAPYYYGGRVEAFKIGEVKDNFSIIDINSAYPFAMMSLHPCGKQIMTQTEIPQNDGELSRSFITLDAISCGVFPFRAKNGSLCFPDDGLIRTFNVTGWEYIAARDTGHLRQAEITSVKTLDEKIEFSEYLDHFYKMKTEAKENGFKNGEWNLEYKARYEFAKRFLNSLYGKMGANPRHYDEYMVVEPKHVSAAAQDDGYGIVCPLGKLVLVSKPLDEEKHRYYNVAIAASITGFVRAHLWRAICDCRAAKGKILYCDTDCLWATRIGDIPMHPTDLGAWDIEAECDFGAIGGKKLYAARTNKKGDGPQKRAWKTACKGVRLSVEEIIDVANGQKVTYSPENPTFSVKRGVHFVSRTINRSAQIDETTNEANDG